MAKEMFADLARYVKQNTELFTNGIKPECSDPTWNTGTMRTCIIAWCSGKSTRAEARSIP